MGSADARSAGWCAGSDAPRPGQCSAGSRGPRTPAYAAGVVPNVLRSALWRNPAFVRVWTAASISIFGSYISGIVVPWVAILVLGAGPLELAALGSVELVAALLVGLIAGAWIDR